MAASQPRDPLTQVQDCLDQLATQLFASFYYTTNYAAPAHINGQPFQPGLKAEDAATAAAAAVAAAESQANASQPATPGPTTASSPQVQSQPPTAEDKVSKNPTREEFLNVLQELAQDLLVKEQQIEMLVRELPGIDRTQDQQEDRLRELNAEMESVRAEWNEANTRRDGLRERIEGYILRTRRV